MTTFSEQFPIVFQALNVGFLQTLKLFFVTLIGAIPLGLIISFGSMSRWSPLGFLRPYLKNLPKDGKLTWWQKTQLWFAVDFRPIRLIVRFVIWVVRGTPLMLQLLFVYFALPMIGIRLPDIAAALLAFTLNYAAYFAEIFRAGIQSVPKGQYEAARTLGMNYTQTMRRIILPQVIRIVLPPVSNETINLVKDTSLIYILAMNDLLRVARTIVQREFDMTPFLIAGVFYLAMTFVLTWMFKKLEAYYGKYDK